MRDQGGNFQAYGIGGVNLQNLWGDHPEAYYGIRGTTHSNQLGIAVSQFPNFLIMFGPNSVAPWANLTTVFQTQAEYVVKVIRHIKKENSRRNGVPYAMQVKPTVQREFND